MQDDFERRAFYAQLGYMMPTRDIELALRFEDVDDHRALANIGDVRIYQASLNYYRKRDRLKVMLSYIRRQELLRDAGPAGRASVPALDNDAVVASAMIRF